MYKNSLMRSAFPLLDPDYTYFPSLLNVLVATVSVDAAALANASGAKYNTNRPKGKLDSTQVGVDG